jgi:hypothetical protein
MTAADFQTPDLPTAALLVVNGYPVRRTILNGGQVTFVFDAAASRAADYDAGAMVNARLFAIALRQLRVRVARELAAARQR